MNSRNGCDPDHRTIAVVGFSARSAAQSARRQGFDVIAVDACVDRDLVSQCQRHYRLDDPKWPDVLNALHPGVPLLLTGGMEHRTDCVDRCHSMAKRGGPDGRQLSAMRTLDNWEKWSVSSELGWPTTFRKIQDFTMFPARLAGEGWLLKPFHSAGGIGIIDLTETVLLRDLLLLSDPLHEKTANAYLQKRLPGIAIGVTFLSSAFGSAIVGATAAWSPDTNSKTSRYVYRGSYGPTLLTDEQIDRLHRFAGIVGRESGFLGLWQADFIAHDGLLTLLEINPRWSASMDILDVCLDLRLVEMHYECIRKNLSTAAFEQFAMKACKRAREFTESMMGKLVVYAPHGFTVSQAQSDHWWSNKWECDMNTLRDRCQFADIPLAGTEVAIGNPILTVLTSGRSRESILCELQTEKSVVEAFSSKN